MTMTWYNMLPKEDWIYRGMSAYFLINPWCGSGGFKENGINLAVAVVLNTIDAHAVYFLSHSPDDGAQWTFSKLVDYAKLWEEAKIPKCRVSDQLSLLVWSTESGDNLQSSPRRSWSFSFALGNAPKSFTQLCKAWELPAGKGLRITVDGVGAKDTLSSRVKAFLRFRSFHTAQEEVVQRDWNLHPQIFKVG